MRKHDPQFDAAGFLDFLVDAVGHYEKCAPTVADHLDDLYRRLNEDCSLVTVLEVIRVAGLFEAGEWEHPNYAANRIYKMRAQLGMDTTGELGF